MSLKAKAIQPPVFGVVTVSTAAEKLDVYVYDEFVTILATITVIWSFAKAPLLAKSIVSEGMLVIRRKASRVLHCNEV